MTTDVWLVEPVVASDDDRVHALPGADAGAWLRAFAPEVDPQTREDVEAGRLLVVVRPVALPAFDDPPAGVSLLEIAGDELEPGPVEEQAPEDAWVDVRIVDRKGRPREGVLYELTLPDGAVTMGRTNAEGHVRVEDLQPSGDCRIRFPELDARAGTPAAPSC